MSSKAESESDDVTQEEDSSIVPESETSQQDDCGSLNEKGESENNMEVEVVDDDMAEDEKSTETMIVSQPTTPKSRASKRQTRKESLTSKVPKRENILEIDGSHDDKSEDETAIVTRRSARRNAKCIKDGEDKAGDGNLNDSFGQYDNERKEPNSDDAMSNIGYKQPARRVARTSSNKKSSAARSRKSAQANSRGKSNKSSNSLKGKGRRSMFKKVPTKAPSSVARSMTSDRAYYHGQYYAKGDIVSVEDIDGGIYYAQIRGFLTDQFCEKSCVITWLMPTRHSPDPNERFDPATYVIGPEEDLPRKLEFFTFVMHAPDDYYYYKRAPYPTDAISTDQEYVLTRMGPRVRFTNSEGNAFYSN